MLAILFGLCYRGAESLQPCIEFICSNYSKNRDNTDIAQAGFISPYYLNKRFKEVAGETPLQYLTKVRLRVAMAMLHNPDYTIDLIAHQCGFWNANYFTKVYKKYTGLTPTEFRAQKISTIIPSIFARFFEIHHDCRRISRGGYEQEDIGEDFTSAIIM